MQGLRFTPGKSSSTDPDTRLLSDAELEAASREGKSRAG
jgi:hypothetical protein